MPNSLKTGMAVKMLSIIMRAMHGNGRGRHGKRDQAEGDVPASQRLRSMDRVDASGIAAWPGVRAVIIPPEKR